MLALVVAASAVLTTHARDDGRRVGVGVPGSFDCGMRRLAYDFGRTLLPRQGSFESLYFALNLNDPSCSTKPGPLQGDSDSHPRADASVTMPEGTVYVDAAVGEDQGLGTMSAPLKSLQAAVDLVAQGSAKDRYVVLRSGTHFLEAPVLLGPEHSGMTITALPGENPVVSGGKKVEVAWEPHQVSNVKNIYKANIKGQVDEVPGLQLNGVRATRARYPNLPGGIEVSPGYGAMIGQNDAAWTPPLQGRFPPVQYYVDNAREHLRDNTEDGEFQRYMVGVQGHCGVYDPPVSYWCAEHPSGGGPEPFMTPSGVTPKPGKLPNAPYKDVNEMEVHFWHFARWENYMFQIEHYDPATNNFTFGAGGNQGARGHKTGGDFFVENVLEELDNPGEFFWDKVSGDLYLFYNGTGAPPADMEVVVPQMKVLVNITGTQWDPVKALTIEKTTFRAARNTYMEPHAVPAGGDWALDRISAVFLQGTEDVTVQNNVFERLDGNAVMLSGYNRRASVLSNDFSYIGANAMISWGYTNQTENSGFPYYTPMDNSPQAGIDGTDGNHPLDNRIWGNTAREVGLYEKQSSFYMQSKTARSSISGNVFFNGPRAGVNFNDGFGGGDELSSNLIFASCRESGDHGPFNSWDRQPFLTNIRTGEPSMIMQWRELHHNFLIDEYSPQENVDNDDGSQFFKTHHNLMVYGGNGMKNDFGGHDNHQYDNLYAYIGQAMGVVKTLPGHQDVFFNNKVVLTGNSVGGPQCGDPATFMGDNQYFTPTGDIQVCGKQLEEAQKDGKDFGSTVAKVPEDAVILDWARSLLSIPRPSTQSEMEGASEVESAIVGLFV